MYDGPTVDSYHNNYHRGYLKQLGYKIPEVLLFHHLLLRLRYYEHLELLYQDPHQYQRQ